jgi:hypothetical protein
MIKFLLLMILSTKMAFASFNCSIPVDEKKVVLFLDTRASKSEVTSAAKAACERGEAFLRLPKASTVLNRDHLQSTFNELAAQNVAVTAVVASGHDGGGYVSGSDPQGYHSFSKNDIIETFKAAYSNSPELKKQFKSIYMWGCWTMGPSEVQIWRQSLPDLKIMAGFIDKGPLNTTLATKTILYDLLMQEKNIYLESDVQKLRRTLTGITHINQTYAAVFAKALCGDRYFYITDGKASKDSHDLHMKAGTHYVDFNDTFDCERIQADVDRNFELFMKYYNGDIPLPPDNAQSEVLAIYSFIRSHSYCVKNNPMFNGDRVALLRFFEDVKFNFERVFLKEIGAAHREFLNLDILTRALPSQHPLMADFQDYFSKNKHLYFPPSAKILKDKDRKEIREMIHFLNGLTAHPATALPHLKDKMIALNKVKNAMEIYLYQLDPRCMDYLMWHDRSNDVMPKAKCGI